MNIVIVAGGTRPESSTVKLCRYLGKLVEEAGHEAALIDLYELPLPLYLAKTDQSGDDNLARWMETAAKADAWILATPEYHGSMTGVLKNALDHLSSEHFEGKAVLSASSAGGAVGVSSLTHLQAVVRNLHGVNCPEWISIGGDARTFDPDGLPSQTKVQERALRVLQSFMRLAQSVQDSQ